MQRNISDSGIENGKKKKENNKEILVNRKTENGKKNKEKRKEI